MENTLCILIGINYKGTKHELKGCINDVKLMENFFIKYLNIKKKNIIILTDDTKIKPTKFNIINQIKFNINKLNNNKKYKNLWIHYSGHGYKLKDKNKDELDLNDEIICTLPSNNNDCNYIVARRRGRRLGLGIGLIRPATNLAGIGSVTHLLVAA